MKPGDVVRDRANLKGKVRAVWGDLVLVEWTENVTWISRHRLTVKQ